MTNPMLAELDEVVRLAEKATPGPWESASRGRYYVGQQEDEASVHGADDADIDEVSNVSPLHLADTIRGDCYKPDADLIAAAVNFLRTHHATLADMAKRLEATEPDPALLASMATCLHHGFGMLDARQQQSMLHDMRKLWDEVMGRGYYRPENRERYMAYVHPAAIDATQEGEG